MKKKTKRRNRLIRAGIQLFFFLMAPAVFATAFSGVKYLFQQIGNVSPIAFVSFFRVLLAICLFNIVFGRYFCGFACAFGGLGDLLYGLSSLIQKKCKKKLPKIPDKVVSSGMYLKYLILTGLLLTCLTGIYGKLQGSSPWDVFSNLTAGRIPAEGYQIGILILVLVLIGMCFEERFFCKFLCPMGAIFALLPVMPFSVYRRNREHCIPKCSACKKECPVHLDIEQDGVHTGECLQCGKCLDTCPKGNIHSAIQGNLYNLLKGAVLFGILYLLGCTR